MYTQAVRDGVDFNVASIPEDFTEVSKSTFDQNYMKKLYKRGYQTADSPEPRGRRHLLTMYNDFTSKGLAPPCA